MKEDLYSVRKDALTALLGQYYEMVSSVSVATLNGRTALAADYTHGLRVIKSKIESVGIKPEEIASILLQNIVDEYQGQWEYRGTRRFNLLTKYMRALDKFSTGEN